MKLSTLARLPASLLAVSLALLVSSAPAQSTEETSKSILLTPDNYDATTASGTWFVEFFSPYCPHCRAFAPLWETLIEEVEKIPSSGLNMAQVNCALYGDLCKRLEIESYPKMNMYKDGKFLETFKKPRDHAMLTEFMAGYISTPSPTETPEPVPTEPVVPVNPTGEVLILTSDNFQDVISEGRVFVKFFAPWCGHCKKLAPTWTQLAQQMKNQLKIAEINCDDHNPVCRSQDIQGFPMLFYYDEDGVKTEYTGGRKLNQLDAFVEKLIAPAVTEITLDSFTTQLNANEVVFTLLISPSDTLSTPLLTKSSSVLLGSVPVFVSNAEDLHSHLSIDSSELPMLLAWKDGHTKPAASMKLETTDNVEKLKLWLLRNHLPTAVELDSDNFQQVMNPKLFDPPLVVIAVVSENNKADTTTILRRLSNKWSEDKGKDTSRSVVFAHMDANKWGKWLKGMYGIKGAEDAKVPPIVIADHTKLVYYDLDADGAKLHSTSIMSVLEKAISGTIKFKNSENLLERFARSLNEGLIVAEAYVRANPGTVILFALCGFVLFVLFVRRLLADTDEAVVRNGKYEKPASGKRTDRID